MNKKSMKKNWSLLLSVIFMLFCVSFGENAAQANQNQSILQQTTQILSLENEGYNVDNLDVEFTSVDEKRISSRSDGVVTVLVFARTNGSCSNSVEAVRSLCNSSWIQNEKVRVVVVDIDGSSRETVKRMQQDNKSGAAEFCYDETKAASGSMWEYLKRTIGASASVSLPVTVIIDSDNKVQYCQTGFVNADSLYPYVSKLAGWGEQDIMEGPLDVYVEGNFDEKQAFQVLDKVNEARAKQGLNPLIMDEALMRQAMQRAAECSVYYSHTRPNGASCFSILDSEYRGRCAENIAAGYKSADSVMTGWLNSSGHYANIMGDSFKSIGIGCFYQNGTIYWTQLFSGYSKTEKTEGENIKGKTVVQADVSYLGKFSLEYKTESLAQGKSASPILRISNLGFGMSTPATDNIVFQTSNAKVAAVDQDGTLHAVAPGEAVITAILDGKCKADYSITVTEEKGDEYGASNLDVEFTTVDGKKISSRSDGVVTVLVFARTNGSCLNSDAEVKSLCDSNWIKNKNVRVLVIDIDGSSMETVKRMQQTNKSDTALFCYDETNAAGRIMMEYLGKTIGIETSVTLPVTVLIDGNNRVQHCMKGYVDANSVYAYASRLAGWKDDNGQTPSSQAPAGRPSEKPDAPGTEKPITRPSAQPTTSPTALPNITRGDVNQDGYVNLTDAQLTLQAALGIITLTGNTETAADLDQNGTINLTDAQMCLKLALGISLDETENGKEQNNISGITYETQKIDDGIDCTVKNNNSDANNIDAAAYFCDGSARIDASFESNDCFEANAEGVLCFCPTLELNAGQFLRYNDCELRQNNHSIV